MARTFTHWMVVKEALDKYNRLPQKHPYFSSILGLNHFVCLGAVGPDYPYLTELLGSYFKVHSWADRMHYENTGEFVRYGVRNLQSLNGDAFTFCLDGGYSAMLCDSQTNRKIMEDLSCHLDRVEIRSWERDVESPCVFESNWKPYCQ